MVNIDNFFSKFTPIVFKSGETIITADRDPSGVFLLKSGFVRQFIITKSGQELTLHFFKPGSFFPLFWAVNNAPNRYHYQAFNKVETVLAPKAEFIAFLKKEPELLYDLSSRILYGLEGLLTRIETLSSADAKTRVIDILLFLAKHFGKKEETITLTEKFTHQDIANLAGTTRETVSRELEDLSRQGLISQDNQQLQISSKLVELSQ